MNLRTEVVKNVGTGQTIQALRQQAQMTQEQLAERLFVSRELVSKWELGQRKPDIRLLREMAALFSVEIDVLADTDPFAGELSSCLPPDMALSEAEFAALLADFLAALSERDRNVFLRRYYYLETPAEIGKAFDVKENHVRSILSRTRKKLKKYLKGAAL